MKFLEIESSYTASISTQTKKTKNTLKDCIYLKESSLFVNYYTCLWTVGSVVPMNLLGIWFCMCFMWSFVHVLLSTCWLVVSFGFLSFFACQCVNKLLSLIADGWLYLWHWNSCWGMFCGGANHWICGWVCTFTDRDWLWQVEFLRNLGFMPSSWCS